MVFKQISERCKSKVHPMKSSNRIVLAFIIGFLAGVFISLSNGRDLLSSLLSGFIIAIITVAIVILLSWGIDIAVKKGYPGWLGFVLVLIFNVFGLMLLAVLRNKTANI